MDARVHRGCIVYVKVNARSLVASLLLNKFARWSTTISHTGQCWLLDTSY
jgi:hypothetical protein